MPTRSSKKPPPNQPSSRTRDGAQSPPRIAAPAPLPSAPRPRRPRDAAQLAWAVVAEATGMEPTVPIKAALAKSPEREKNPHAVALGKLGGAKGGAARAASLSKKDREEIARIAATARWKKK